MNKERQQPVKVATWSQLTDRRPHGVRVAEVDLVVVRHDDRVSVLEGRCPHRAGKLVGGRIDGERLICPFHGWDFHCGSGVSAGVEGESIHRFDAWVESDAVWVDEAAVRHWRSVTPQAFADDEILGPDDDEPT